ncbi:hypothetical protein SAY86_012089 [Trapa natans]|uniref:Transcription factor TFIIIC triple barrel domain-containing protein n=1 Tax=Trapa natans TaxID=22666 RepID=A0AAN7MCH2_TRANT|nr:hypothetical protein SAY86_012089 [Trapa natans]
MREANVDLFDPRTIMDSDSTPVRPSVTGSESDFGFAFNHSNFSDRVLQVEIVPHLHDFKSDGEGCSSLADWTRNLKRPREETKKDNEMEHNSVESGQEIEEEYVLLDLESVSEVVDIPPNAPYVLSGLDTLNPVLVIDNRLKLIGHYEESIGTCIIFSENDVSSKVHVETGPTDASLFAGKHMEESNKAPKKEVRPEASLTKILKFRLSPDFDIQDETAKENGQAPEVARVFQPDKEWNFRDTDPRAREDTESKIDHLEVLGTGDGGEVVGTCPDVEDEGLLEPRDEEVCPLTHSLLHHPANPIQDDRPLASVHRVEGPNAALATLVR